MVETVTAATAVTKEVEVKESAPPASEVPQPSAAPVKTMETADLLSMNRQQLAEFTAQVTSDASTKVEEMNRQMQAQQEELATLRAEHEKRVAEEKNQQRKAFDDKMNELKNEGFNQDGLLMGIETMAKTDMGSAMSMLSNIVAASRAKEEERQKHLASMEARKEEEVKQHFADAAASYKRLLSGSIMASSETKRAKTVSAPTPAPVSAPVVTTTIKAHEAAPTPAATAAPVVPSVQTMPSVCRTYMEANALLRRNAGTVQASALGRTPMKAVREVNLTKTDEQKGLHGLQHFNQPLFEELVNANSVLNVNAAMHQTASFLKSRSMW